MEGVNLSNFVYDTKDLSTIRGGGLLLLNSVREVQERFNLDPISTGASSGLFEFEATVDGTVETLLTEIRAFLDQDEKYRHATFVVDARPAEREADFVHNKETLIADNRWQQMRSPSIAIPPLNEDHKIGPCAKDRVRPANEPGKEKVSLSVASRHDYGKEQKQLFYESQTGRPIVRNQNQPRWFTNDFAGLAAFGAEERRQINPNLNDKMAVIYIDGNNFGTIQTDHCKTVEAQIAFDTTLQNARKELMRGLIDYMEGGDHWLADGNRYRIETLLWGGDEILWVVPAWQGLRTLEFFYKQAQEKNWHFQGLTETVPLTHSAGVVFCNHKAPIHRVRKLAEDLANSVKDQTERSGNCFAYEILESFDHIGRDLEKYRHERIPFSLKPASPEADQSTKDLILDGDLIFKPEQSIIAVASKLKNTLPRRRLAGIVRELLKPDRQEEVERQVKELLAEIPGEHGALRDLFLRFGGNQTGNDAADYVAQPMIWMHLNALWDYLAIE
jgi:hypothetical protein